MGEKELENNPNRKNVYQNEEFIVEGNDDEYVTPRPDKNRNDEYTANGNNDFLVVSESEDDNDTPNNIHDAEFIIPENNKKTGFVHKD